MQEKSSYFNVNRCLTDLEWNELKLWRKNHPQNKWKAGDVCSSTGLVFSAYSINCKNGELWASPDKFEEAKKKRQDYIDNNRDSIRDTKKKSLSKKLEEDPDYKKKVSKKYRDSLPEDRKQEIWKREYQRALKNNALKTPEQLRGAKLKVVESLKNKYRENKVFALSVCLRSSINKGFRQNGFKKKARTKDILGIDFPEFKNYLESKFEPWMNWDNKAGKSIPPELNKTWDIDHIIPISTANTPEDVIKLNHYTNLRPLCAYTNRHIKKDRLDWGTS